MQGNAAKEEKYVVRLQAIIETTLIITGLLAQLFLLPHGMYGDGATRFLALSQLLQQGTLSHTEYSLVGPLFSTPFWFLGKWFWTPENMCTVYNLFLVACGLLFVYILLKDRVDRGLLRKFFLILIAASMFSMHVTAYYGEVFTAICVGFGILAVSLQTFAAAGWIAVILGVVNTPASILGLICLVITYVLESKRLRYILIILAAAALIMAEAWLRRGSPFNTGYEHNAGYRTVMPYSGLPGFSYPFFFGLLSILLSFGKGLVFFAPGLLLPVRKTLHQMRQWMKLDLYRIYVLWLSFLIGLILIYAKWWAWYGGLFWGPRFFLFASIPASFALAVRLQQKDVSFLLNLFTLLVLCLSFWVGLDGAVYAGTSVPIPLCMINHAQLEFLCHYTLEFSALWYPFVVRQYLDPQEAFYAAYWVVAFSYLLIPLLIKVIEQGIEVIGHFTRSQLDRSLWRF